MHEELFFDTNIQKTEHNDISMTNNFLTIEEINESENILKKINQKNLNDLDKDLINKLNKVVKALV